MKNLQFSSDSHNVSLVGAEVGSGANQTRTLVLKQALKSANQPEETIAITKALEQITVTLSMEEFLRKFFGMWSDDAETLTKLMGFETEYESYKREQESKGEESWDYSKYLEEKVSQFKILKSMNEGIVTQITKSAFEEIVALQQKHETALVEHINKKVKQMEELELVKSALSAKDAELTTQVELVKSLESKVAELEQSISVFKAAEDKAKFDAFAAQLNGLVAEDKFEQVAKGLYALHNVDVDAATASIEALKSAATNAKVLADGLTQEQSHAEVTNAQDVAKAQEAELIKAAYQKQSRK